MSEETLLEFPCTFPIKAVGEIEKDFDVLIIELISKHATVNEAAISSRASKGGRYLAVTIVIEASSKQQLDAIYQELSDHPQVLMAL